MPARRRGSSAPASTKSYQGRHGMSKGHADLRPSRRSRPRRHAAAAGADAVANSPALRAEVEIGHPMARIRRRAAAGLPYLRGSGEARRPSGRRVPAWPPHTPREQLATVGEVRRRVGATPTIRVLAAAPASDRRSAPARARGDQTPANLAPRPATRPPRAFPRPDPLEFTGKIQGDASTAGRPPSVQAAADLSQASPSLLRPSSSVRQDLPNPCMP